VRLFADIVSKNGQPAVERRADADGTISDLQRERWRGWARG